MGLNIARKIRVTRFALLLPVVIFAADAWYLFALIAVAVAAHEAGHYFALRVSGGEVLRVTISALGVAMRYGGHLSYGGEVFTALMGPVASGLLALACIALGRTAGAFQTQLFQLSGVSLLLGAFNLLPVYPLDGGRALYNALAYRFGLDAAASVTRVARIVVIALVAAGGMWFVTRPERNPTLLLCALGMTISRE
jgi:Zn-dependent protease